MAAPRSIAARDSPACRCFVVWYIGPVFPQGLAGGYLADWSLPYRHKYSLPGWREPQLSPPIDSGMSHAPGFPDRMGGPSSDTPGPGCGRSDSFGDPTNQ